MSSPQILKKKRTKNRFLLLMYSYLSIFLCHLHLSLFFKQNALLFQYYKDITLHLLLKVWKFCLLKKKNFDSYKIHFCAQCLVAMKLYNLVFKFSQWLFWIIHSFSLSCNSISVIYFHISQLSPFCSGLFAYLCPTPH